MGRPSFFNADGGKAQKPPMGGNEEWMDFLLKMQKCERNDLEKRKGTGTTI